jgi:hypothetical protein
MVAGSVTSDFGEQEHLYGFAFASCAASISDLF